MKTESRISDRKKRHDDFVQKTIAFWKRKAGVTLTTDEAEDAIRNVCELIRFLAQLDKKQKAEAAALANKDKNHETNT